MLKANNGGLIKDVIAPKLLLEVDKIRQEKALHDPNSVERVDSELNRGRINFMVIGTGSELAWNEENADAFMVVSYSIADNKLSFISLHRDVMAPEISKVTSGQHELMTALHFGGIPLAEEIIENTTGLSMDYYVKLRHEAISEFIERIFGKLRVTVPQDIPLDQYGVSFDEGQQEMNGTRILQYLETRTSSNMERRNSAQQQVLEIIMDELFNYLGSQNPIQSIQMLTNIQNVSSDLTQAGKMKTNLNITTIIDIVKNEWLAVAKRFIGSKLAGGQFLGKPTLTKTVFGDYEIVGKIPGDHDPREALRAYLDPATKEPIVDVPRERLIEKYYQLPRTRVRELLIGQPPHLEGDNFPQK